MLILKKLCVLKLNVTYCAVFSFRIVIWNTESSSKDQHPVTLSPNYRSIPWGRRV